MIHGFPNGATRLVEDQSPEREQTQGTETSKYLEEKKTSSDPPSSGERKGDSPNRKRFGAAGVVGPQRGLSMCSGTLWKGGP